MNEKHQPHPPVLQCCVSPMELAQAYVCPQKFEGIFPPEEGLRMGTIFPALSQPYVERTQRGAQV
ncbi:MAG: spore coat associated protein CotJA [Defluviitaleaceae bacterium]|nr:spore coat associated protein CotJA [Defluviitaleaceae bacterium]